MVDNNPNTDTNQTGPSQKEIKAALNDILSPLMDAGNQYFASTIKFHTALSKAKKPGNFNLWDFGNLSKIRYEKLKNYIETTEKFILSKPSAFFSHPMVRPKIQEHLLVINEELIELNKNWAKLTLTLGLDPDVISVAAKMDKAGDRKPMLFINQKNRVFSESLVHGKMKLDELDEKAEKLEKRLVTKLRR